MELTWPRSLAARRSRDRTPREPLSIRALNRIAAILSAALLIVAALGLTYSGLDTRRSTDEWLRATEGQDHVDAALVHLLTFRSQSDLWFATREPEMLRQREEVASELERDLRSARALAVDPRERALLERTRVRAAEYMATRARLDETAPRLSVIVRETRRHLDAVTRPLEELRALHDEQARAAYRNIRRSVVLSDVIGAGLTIAFAAAVLALLVGMRREVVAPVLALHRALERFRSGELDARCSERGAREVRDVARSYNAMADTLAAQREGQLNYLAGVAHDLRNPLGTMKVGVSLVGAEEQMSERGRRTLGLLDRQVDRITRMVDDLLELTSIEAGRLSLEPELVDLRERAREAVALHAPASPEHDIVVTEAGEPVRVRADPGRVDQVLTNLLTNALKFSPAGSRVEVRVFARGDDAVIEVEDHGIGMTADEVADLFAPFRRHAPSLAPGAGLGLSVVRRIVRAHGGRVEVESEPRVGSTFRVVLALAHDEEDARGGRADRR